MGKPIHLEVSVTPPADGDGWVVDVCLLSGRSGRYGRTEAPFVEDAFKEALLIALASEPYPRDHA